MRRASDRLGSGATRDLVVASYNIHRCVGADGRMAPERIAEVLRELGADVVALQEVDSALPEHGIDQLAFLSRASGGTPVAGPTLVLHKGSYGNAMLVRWPVLAVRRHDLSVPGREPRGALDVELDVGGVGLRVVATHFGLRRSERVRQAQALLAIIGPRRRPTVLLGDLNEWLPGMGAQRLFDERFGRAPRPSTFPALRPLLKLDRMWVDPPAALVDLAAHATRLTRMASDHLPIRGLVDLAALVSSSPGVAV